MIGKPTTGRYCSQSSSHPGECQPHGPRPSSAPGTAAEELPPPKRPGGSEALRRFEQRLIPARTTAGQVESWEAYNADMLPPRGDGTRDGDLQLERERGHINQGFAAGYDAAMSRVRSILNDVQTEILRENR